MAEGFLGRWSQRKQAVRAGQALVEPVPAPVPDSDLPLAVAKAAKPSGPAAAAAQADWPPALARQGEQQQGEGAQPALDPQPVPTLTDVAALKPDDSFARFVAPDVAPEVRNAAMKKLFTDPHYNVMDGLDIYIDDYSVPSPLPAATLRQMASAKFLNLFEEEPAVVPDATATSTATSPTLVPIELAALPPTNDLMEKSPDDHLDLRLQPDHAARFPGLERQPERAPDAAFEPVPPPSC